MTYVTPTANPGAAPAPAVTSKAALFSFIFGILGCLPILTGALALLLGIIGFIKTGKPGVKGRWMAIIGAILGALSLTVWSFVLIMGLAGWGIFAATAAPREASHAFLKDLAAGNITAAGSKTGGIPPAELQDIADYMSRQGRYEDATFLRTQINNDRASLAGIVKFSSGPQSIEVELKKIGPDWKIMQIEIKP